ncbi:hypothetical protein I316_03418 [Kwoniella heveanensis BCC8398]|uniref:Uncharacterized protein n=1 Tax=Kwoniella heveanensis BCC8398 TaxID=1296120 RepID=A0A1B9GV45_9TREE|nr:hypothetical protein I316_03418 [Kwoniella heveanensis BCC8398]
MVASLQILDDNHMRGIDTRLQPSISAPYDPKGKGKARAEPEAEITSGRPGQKDDLGLAMEINGRVQIVDGKGDQLFYRAFRSEEEDLKGIMRLVEQELSEPPHLTFLRPWGSPDPIAHALLTEWNHTGFPTTRFDRANSYHNM